jgi:predicted nuclease of predicted toxin-antitoxin system
VKFLADMGISMSTVQALRSQDHDATHLREQGLERLSDPDILEKARRERRVVLTFDLDFGDLLATGLDTFPSVIIFRLSNETPTVVTRRLRDVLSHLARELEEGVIVIVEDTRHRVRHLPLKP